MISGHRLSPHTPCVAVHERAVHKVHVDADVGGLIQAKGVQRCGPIIVDAYNAISFKVFITCLCCFGDVCDVRVVM